jgi:SAM-dependent methyltransferase
VSIDAPAGRRLRAAVRDAVLCGAERAFVPQRRALLARARGRVLEIGAGSGANVPHYPDGLDELILSEPDAAMLRRAERRAAACGRSPATVLAPAEALPFDDASFDTVVSTLVLCSVADVERTLAEVRRVLRPDGVLLFCEHVRSVDERLAAWQDRLDRPWRALNGGCHANRATVTSIEAGPFRLVEIAHGRMPYRAPAIVRPLATGVAAVREPAQASAADEARRASTRA